MEIRLTNILNTRKVTKLSKTILETSYTVLQVTSKWKTLNQSIDLLRAFKFWATFDIQINITWLHYGKSRQTTTFRKPPEVSQNMPALI